MNFYYSDTKNIISPRGVGEIWWYNEIQWKYNETYSVFGTEQNHNNQKGHNDTPPETDFHFMHMKFRSNGRKLTTDSNI